MVRILISHEPFDLLTAEPLTEWLRRGFGNNAVGRTADQLGSNYGQDPFRAVRDCDVFVLLVSPKVLASQRCMTEWTIARQANKLCLPVVITSVDQNYLQTVNRDVANFINQNYAVDLTHGLSDGQAMGRLYEMLRRYLQQSVPAAETSAQQTFEEGRLLQAAIPQECALRVPTQVRVMLCTPQSAGLHSYGEASIDAAQVGSPQPQQQRGPALRYPTDMTTGQPSAVYIEIVLESDVFQVNPPSQRLTLTYGQDSRLAQFTVLPLQPSPSATLTIHATLIWPNQQRQALISTNLTSFIVGQRAPYAPRSAWVMRSVPLGANTGQAPTSGAGFGFELPRDHPDYGNTGAGGFTGNPVEDYGASFGGGSFTGNPAEDYGGGFTGNPADDYGASFGGGSYNGMPIDDYGGSFGGGSNQFQNLSDSRPSRPSNPLGHNVNTDSQGLEQADLPKGLLPPSSQAQGAANPASSGGNVAIFGVVFALMLGLIAILFFGSQAALTPSQPSNSPPTIVVTLGPMQPTVLPTTFVQVLGESPFNIMRDPQYIESSDPDTVLRSCTNSGYNLVSLMQLQQALLQNAIAVPNNQLEMVQSVVGQTVVISIVQIGLGGQVTIISQNTASPNAGYRCVQR